MTRMKVEQGNRISPKVWKAKKWTPISPGTFCGHCITKLHRRCQMSKNFKNSPSISWYCSRWLISQAVSYLANTYCAFIQTANLSGHPHSTIGTEDTLLALVPNLICCMNVGLDPSGNLWKGECMNSYMLVHSTCTHKQLPQFQCWYHRWCFHFGLNQTRSTTL